MGERAQPEPSYLGDGVYAAADSGMIRLTVGHHDPRLADHELFLEPEVYAALVAYAKLVWPEAEHG